MNDRSGVLSRGLVRWNSAPGCSLRSKKKRRGPARTSPLIHREITMTADPEGLVVLAEVKTGFEAEAIAHALDAQGIRATVADAVTTELFSGAIGSAKVMV